MTYFYLGKIVSEQFYSISLILVMVTLFRPSGHVSLCNVSTAGLVCNFTSHSVVMTLDSMVQRRAIKTGLACIRAALGFQAFLVAGPKTY